MDKCLAVCAIINLLGEIAWGVFGKPSDAPMYATGFFIIGTAIIVGCAREWIEEREE